MPSYISKSRYGHLQDNLILKNTCENGSDFMEHEAHISYTDTNTLPEIPKDFANQAFQFQELMMMYNCAIRGGRGGGGGGEGGRGGGRGGGAGEHITSRIKRPLSIIQKLGRYDAPFTVESVEERLNDVAGIRVICSFIDDIYAIADMLLQQDDITLIRQKDYIQNPKPNGYRSLHLIVEIPVFFSEQKKNMRVEVQIRTIAMDFWASVDHQLKYKQDVENPEAVSAELKECADIIAQTDARMLAIKNHIYFNEPFHKSWQDKLEKLDLPLNR